jgi:uncharacterized repeat protein (TIGR03847 family)
MWDLGHAQLLEPEAIGEPGKREFRLRVMSGADAASLWMEKEQMAALSLAIRQLLDQTPEGDSEDEPDAGPPEGRFPTDAKIDFRIGRLGIGYDETNRMVIIFAYTPEDSDTDSPSFACRVTRGQSRVFADQAEEVVSAGRPICFLCGGPIEKGDHKCGRRNGHSRQPVAFEDDDD